MNKIPDNLKFWRKTILLRLVVILAVSMTLASCKSEEEWRKETLENSLSKYEQAYGTLKSAFNSGTRNGSDSEAIMKFEGEVTREEIEYISNLHILSNYDEARLQEISESEVYNEMYTEAEEAMSAAKSEFIEAYSLSEFQEFKAFMADYILSGTHNPSMLNSAIHHFTDERLQNAYVLAVSVIDAYGEEEVWKDTYQIDSPVDCDRAAINNIALIIGVLAFNLSVDAAIPWMAILNGLSTIDAICQLVTVHNKWILCHRAFNRKYQ